MPASDSDPKTVLRARAHEVRRRAHARFGARMGAILRNNFFAQFSHPAHTDIAGYWPVADEVDLRPLLSALHRRGHRMALPRVLRRNAPLRFLRWHPGDRLEPGFAGIPEPDAGAEEIHPDVILVPLLGFDGTGRRLGYGGGFYDRSLASLRRRQEICAIGIAYADQEVDSLPPGDHDEPLDWVVTERGSRRFDAAEDAGGGAAGGASG
ncbi:MAG: 5-formyltetrahydrofolate cyclo-ligase [Alphaproteobacteria bacterium]|nr:5-formyltetrahydrofolate cyclo-ligase [Alphaproteobacteria bacterium]